MKTSHFEGRIASSAVERARELIPVWPRPMAMVTLQGIINSKVEPAVLSLAQVRRLLTAAREFKDGQLFPYVALSLFTGIHPTELARINWEHVDLEAGTVTIGAKLAKMRQRRIIEFAQLTNRDPDGKEIHPPANLRDWLLPHVTKRIPFRGKNWRRDFDALKRQLGFGNPAKLPRRKKEPETAAEKAIRLALKPWTPDILRHTAISHHLAYFRHEGKTAAWAGNSPDIIQRHYEGLVKPAEAIRGVTESVFQIVAVMDCPQRTISRQQRWPKRRSRNELAFGCQRPATVPASLELTLPAILRICRSFRLAQPPTRVTYATTFGKSAETR